MSCFVVNETDEREKCPTLQPRTSGKIQIVERGVRVKGKPHCYKDSREV